jgi:hypothetical protein
VSVAENGFDEAIHGVKPYCNFVPSRINCQRHRSDLTVNSYRPVALRGLLDQSAPCSPESITHHASNAHAVEAGHFVCIKLDNGTRTSQP